MPTYCTLSRAAETPEWSTARCLIGAKSLVAASMLVLRFWFRQIRAWLAGRRSAHNSRQRLSHMRKLLSEHFTTKITSKGRIDTTIIFNIQPAAVPNKVLLVLLGS